MNSDKLCYDMKSLQEVMPLGKNNLYNLVHSEGFPKITIGRRILIPKKAFEEWLQTTAVQSV
ncbi:MAG: helix-turn-helix domain-containing protein [Clostridia bacterium]|nr:helix-turn-helix domain-containing protein [Clostridia bacterium]